MLTWLPLSVPASGAEPWPYSKPSPFSAPKETRHAWSRSWIDDFLFDAMAENGLEPAPDADPRRMLRRLHFVLTGLPPTSEQAEKFIGEAEEDFDKAIAGEVDRLLDDPAFGERFGRHWLDVARYADSNGGGANVVFDDAWRYRDYVIRAFQDDRPYDRFVREQIAGDLIGGDDDKARREALTATGFLCLGQKDIAEYDKEKLDYDVADEQIDTIGRAFLGLTLGCARCHDHKFDPITQVDYYGLAGILLSTETLTRNTKGGPLSVWVKRPFPGTKGNVVLAPKDRAKPADAHLLGRGSLEDRREKIPRGFPKIFGGENVNISAGESGRRELAEWLASPDNPLTARVMANRIWLWCLGEGLVRTPDQFGGRGARPTHPELLDALALRFVESGWSVKELTREILTSRVFRLSAVASEEARMADPENSLWSHAKRRRTDAEALRDALLFHAGTLDRTAFGKTLRWTGRLDAGGEKKTNIDASKRRTVYLPRYRGFDQVPLLTLFDAAEASMVTGRRSETLQPGQALVLMNSPLVTGACEAIAKRYSDRGVYVALLGREATRAEAKADAAFLNSGGSAAELVQSIIASNEFLYID